MQEGLKEWIITDEQNMKFHMDQYVRPYRSTVKFAEYLKKKVRRENNKILDLGCGGGAALGYILTSDEKLYKEGYGIDINKELVDIGNKILKERKVYNCELKSGDIFQVHKNEVCKMDGIISLQTFNILPDYKEIARCMCELEPSWIAFSTLGFEGLIDYNIKLFDYTKDKDNGCAEVFYNIYSLPRMKEYFSSLRYSKFDYIEFEMDIDLPQTNKAGRGTYTVKTEEGKRIQISGGMMMPWYFVFVEK
ncbi:class I SAM-dependent methyltransferase [Lachnospiraceae bacterium 54-11]